MSKKHNEAWALENNLTILDAEQIYTDMLDEVYGRVSIAGLEYSISRTLKEIDPTAYRCGMNDYIDSRLQDGDITSLDDETLVPTSEYDDAVEAEEDDAPDYEKGGPDDAA